MLEVWKKTLSCPEYYEVSNLGRVRSLTRSIEGGCCIKGKKATKVIQGKVHSNVLNERGYLVVRIGRKNKYVHRLIAEAFLSNPDNKPQINHINGNKADNSIPNLEWVTSKENVIHAYESGLVRPKKLTIEQRDAIRNRCYKKVIDVTTNTIYASMTEAARAFNVSLPQLSGKLKGHLPNNLPLRYV